MKQLFVCLLATLASSSALSEEPDGSYDAGYKAGFEIGYAAGTTMYRPPPTGPGSVIWKDSEKFGGTTPGTLVIPGTNFSVAINPVKPDAPFTFQPDSSVAIIPQSAIDEIRRKMGADFTSQHMILNNRPGIE